MQVRISVSAVLLMFVFAVSPLRAQYVEIYRLNNIAMELPEQEFMGKLATHLGVSVDTLKQQKEEYKVSVGELYIAHRLAKAANSDVKTVISEFKSGTEWGVYVKEKKIKLDDITKDERQLESVLKKKAQSASK